MADVIFKYAKSVYDGKIGALENCEGQLNTHLNNLDGFKEEIKDFWQEGDSEKYYNLITDNIELVRNAMHEVVKLRAVYEETSAEYGRTSEAIDGTIANVEAVKEDVKDAVGLAGDIAGIAAML